MRSPLQGVVLWLTGPPATGKTTLARSLLDALHQREIITLWLDSDDLRTAFTPHPTYSSEERDTFYGSIGHVAIRAAEGGVTVVISATASKRAYRDAVRTAVPRFVEVALTSPPEVLRERDVKGLYERADAGEISQLPGAGASYEEPLRPELSLSTHNHPPAELVDHVLRWLDANFSSKL